MLLLGWYVEWRVYIEIIGETNSVRFLPLFLVSMAAGVASAYLQLSRQKDTLAIRYRVLLVEQTIREIKEAIASIRAARAHDSDDPEAREVISSAVEHIDWVVHSLLPIYKNDPSKNLFRIVDQLEVYWKKYSMESPNTVKEHGTIP